MKVKTIKINKEKLKFQYDVNLSSDGLFYTVLPENIRILAEKFKIRFNEHRRKKGYIYCKTYDELDIRIKDIGEKITSKNLVSKEIVLMYKIKTNCSYCKTKKGTLVPNGEHQKKEDGFYDWQSGTEQSDSFGHPFGFNIYVKPREKLTYKYYDDSIAVEYETLKDEDIKNDKILKWLEDICNMSLDSFDESKEIIYSPKVGIFFIEALKFIFRFNEQLKLILTKDQELDVKALEFLSFDKEVKCLKKS